LQIPTIKTTVKVFEPLPSSLSATSSLDRLPKRNIGFLDDISDIQEEGINRGSDHLSDYFKEKDPDFGLNFAVEKSPEKVQNK
jgi:hypothetical protein